MERDHSVGNHVSYKKYQKIKNVIDKIKFTYGSDCMILILFCLFLLLFLSGKKSHFAVLVNVVCAPEDAVTEVNWVIIPNTYQ